MRQLCERLSSIPKTADKNLLKEAKNIIERLWEINMRWNIPELTHFLKKRQRELFFSP
ncbi:hypothetical protein JCM12298_06650 [Desulfothermus naphthae]